VSSSALRKVLAESGSGEEMTGQLEKIVLYAELPLHYIGLGYKVTDTMI
jgi:hypothetical protein